MDNNNNIAIARVQTDIEYIKKSVDKLDKNMEDFHKIFTTKDEHQENKKEINILRYTKSIKNSELTLFFVNID